MCFSHVVLTRGGHGLAEASRPVLRFRLVPIMCYVSGMVGMAQQSHFSRVPLRVTRPPGPVSQTGMPMARTPHCGATGLQPNHHRPLSSAPLTLDLCSRQASRSTGSTWQGKLLLQCGGSSAGGCAVAPTNRTAQPLAIAHDCSRAVEWHAQLRRRARELGDKSGHIAWRVTVALRAPFQQTLPAPVASVAAGCAGAGARMRMCRLQSKFACPRRSWLPLGAGFTAVRRPPPRLASWRAFGGRPPAVEVAVTG